MHRIAPASGIHHFSVIDIIIYFIYCSGMIKQVDLHAVVRFWVTPHTNRAGVTINGWDVRRVCVDGYNKEYDGGMVYGGTSLTKREAKRLASELNAKVHAS